MLSGCVWNIALLHGQEPDNSGMGSEPAAPEPPSTGASTSFGLPQPLPAPQQSSEPDEESSTKHPFDNGGGQSSQAPNGANGSNGANQQQAAVKSWRSNFFRRPGKSERTRRCPGNWRISNTRPVSTSRNQPTQAPPPGAASQFGSALPSTSAIPPTFSLFATPGQGTPSFSVGSANLTKPRFHYSISILGGYDDNVFSAPTNSGSPALTQRVLISPAIPAISQTIPILITLPRTRFDIRPRQFVYNYVRYLTKYTPAQYQTFVLRPAIPEEPRLGSFVIRTNASGSVQYASRKTTFVMSLHVGGDFYQSRPGRKVDPTASLSAAVTHRLTSRIQLSSSLNASYITQPSLAFLNTTAGNVGRTTR